MKKKVSAALAAMMLMSVGTAMASSFPEFQFNGDIKLHYRWQNEANGDDTEGAKVWFRLNAQTEVAKNVSLYTRFATQRLTGDNIGADFDKTYYNDDSATSIDRLGFIVKGKDFTTTIGRQGATLGATALLYSTDAYMGNNQGAIDGVTIAGKTGATNVKAVAGQLWDTSKDDTKLYAIDASFKPTKALTLGGTVMKMDNDAGDTNFWAASAAYNIGKATLLGEYAKADSDADDKAYVFGLTYAFDSKNSAYAMYNRAENTFTWTDFDPNGKGMYYGFDHQLDKATTLSFFYKDMKKINAGTGYAAGADYDSLRATVTYKF